MSQRGIEQPIRQGNNSQTVQKRPNRSAEQSNNYRRQPRRQPGNTRDQIYPDENHFLTNVKSHLYKMMEDFLNECFYVEKKEEIEATKVKKDVKGR